MLELKSGEIFAGCKIIDICGKGGYGTVYLAEDATGKHVAVKLISTNKKEQELDGIKNYMPVSRKSPYLLSVFHVGIEQNELFLVMEAADPLTNTGHYLPDTLARRLQIHGRLPAEQVLDIMKKIASATQLLHEAKLLHRDIKPDNVIFVNGQPKLSDPGLVCSTECSITLAGTLGFLPPECFSGTESNSIQSDIYALGKLFYCTITGEQPGRFPYLPQDLSFPVCRKLLPIFLKSCNTKKKKRYNSVAEFLHDLPKKLPRIGVLQKFNESFRTWRLMHTLLWNSLLLFFSAVLAVPAFLYWQVQERKEEYQNRHFAAAVKKKAFEKKINENKSWLLLQLEHLSGTDKGKAQMKKFCTFPADPFKAVEMCKEYAAELNSFALLAAKKNDQIQDSFRRAANKRAFLKSPLGRFLTKEQRQKLYTELKLDEKRNSHKWGKALQLEKKFYPDSSGIFEFVYIPPGDFLSSSTGKRSRIDYPFWVLPEKLSVRQFSRMCQFLPPGSKNQEAVAVRFLWNDILHGCRNSNDMFQIVAPFPEGYIVRPLTDMEWEYCASRKGKGGKGKTNSFGLTGMDDKIYEIISSGKFQHRDSVLAKSSGNKHSKKEFVYYQSFLKNVSTRIAIAPGTKEFYNESLQLGTAQTLEHNGKHYEFFGHLCANFKRREAELLCRFLGGRLASLDSPELIEKINRAASPVIKYNICVAADFKDGKWYWSNGKLITDAPGKPGKGEYFILSGKKFRLTTVKRYLGFICEWTQEEFKARRNWRERMKKWSPNMQKTFQVDGRNFVLIRIFLNYPHLCRRYAEILGGKLAELEDPALRKIVSENIKNFNDRPTLLGGYWQHDKYYWLTSKNEIQEPLQLKGQTIDTAPSLSVPAIQNGTLCAIQLPGQFLVEFPAQDSYGK